MTERDIETVDDLLGALRTELAIDPSPDFAARVRVKIDAAPARSWWRIWMVPVAVAAGVAAVAVVTMWRPAPVVGPGVHSTQTAAVTPIPVPRPGAALTNPTAASRAKTPALARVARPATVVASVGLIADDPMTPTAPPPAAPEVLVPDDQRLAIVSILAAMRTGPSQVPREFVFTLDADGRLPVPDALTIPLIVIELLPPVSDWRER